ncbi:MAG: DUF2752 domain-containing protein [Lachnospiraceae bacterium]|nr:DUF2752 domain-containing protein [Lachnospiraceae bacterium]
MNNKDTCVILYRLGRIALIIGLIALILFRFGLFEPLEPYIYCRFKRATGFLCPGCGGTTALKELLAGHFLKSFCSHPAVLYFAVFYAVFMIRMFLSLRYDSAAVSYKRVVFFIYLGIAIILIQCIIKNIYHIDNLLPFIHHLGHDVFHILLIM